MWPFKRRAKAHETTTADVMASLVSISRRLDAMADSIEANYAAHRSLAGRVHRLWGKGGDPIEAPQTPAELPLSDPKLTKAELRARLLPHGKRFKHTN